MGTIYKATFSNGKAYIGMTTKSITVRKQGHYVAATNGSNFMFHKAIRKYGWDDITWTVICDNIDDVSLLKQAEIESIQEHQTFYKQNGYNMTLGGDGGPSYWFESMTEEEYSEWLSKVMPYFSKTWTSQKRFDAIKESWETDIVRKENLSARMKKQWLDMPEEDKQLIKNIQSEKRKEAHKNGKYHGKQALMTEKARLVVSGTKWYNDGVRNFRLHPTDERTSSLNIGKMKNANNKSS